MKLLIADDDEQIRSGIEQGIDWAALDIHQVITAANGLEALQFFNEQLPEIVVTDVRMPGMDGLELLRRIKEIKPETRVVILSGYNDFEYLKKAIQLHAVDYEMKPIRARNLIALIRKIKEDIIRERVTDQEYLKYLESHKVNFADELLAGSLTDRLVILEGLQRYFGLNATESLVCISVEQDGDWSDCDSAKEVTDATVRLFRSDDLSDHGICLRAKGGKAVFLVQSKTKSYLFYTQFANEWANRLRAWNRKIRSTYHASFSAGISSPGNVYEIEKLHREANHALSMRLYAEPGSINIYDPSLALNDKSIVGLLDNPEFFSQMTRGEWDSAALSVNQEFDRLQRERKHSRRSLSAYSCSLLQMLKVTARNIPADRIERIQNKIEFIERQGQFLRFDEIKESVVSAFEDIAAHLSKGLSQLMIRADEYIRRHYAQELTVEILAAYVGKTPNYFSHLFKREFGVTFKEYINRLRIAKAKELILQSNDLIYEISERVGFADYTYFTRVFKKLEGSSPALLRRQPPIEMSDEGKK